MKRTLVLVLMLAATLAAACLWDYDTAAEEARGNMELVRVLTGRFERNPPLYYEMRLTRMKSEIEKNPRDLDLYDNAAVSAERLGKTDEAIEWIEKKKPELTRQKLPKDHEQWYRYWANAGTFHAHRWLKAKSKDLKELRLARAMIARAIGINPDAHFGRERTQLHVLDWLIAFETKTEGTPLGLGEFLETELKIGKRSPAAAQEVKGLAGLVALGSAWESVDVFQAISYLESLESNASLAQLALERAVELESQGKKALVNGESGFDYPMYMPDRGGAKFTKGEYWRLRNEADAWHRQRTAYMVSRLKEGRHPDTDKQFWDGYDEAAPPELRSPPFWETPRWRVNATATGGLVVVIIILLSPFLLIYLYLRRRSRQRATAAKMRNPQI